MLNLEKIAHWCLPKENYYYSEINNLPNSIEELRIGVQRVKEENRYLLENTPEPRFVKFNKKIEKFCLFHCVKM